MSNTKKCLVYETLNSLSDLTVIEEGKQNGNVRLSGTFGVCGVRNNNKRVYEKDNYGKMVSILQEQLKVGKGVLGELEHPNTMNITLENVSHKIEKIQMNEDGTITGDIVLLNTPKGRIAQAIVEGGVPLYISSRGAGSIDESGNVTLSQLVTYDLVGTPGFSQAEFNLSNNQAFESLNENLCVIYEKCEDCDDNNKNTDNTQMTKEKPSFAKIDANGDGKISLDEWVKSGLDEKLFKEIDTNNDGTISKEEFDAHFEDTTLDKIKEMLLDIRKTIKETKDDEGDGDGKSKEEDGDDKPKNDDGDGESKKDEDNKSKDDGDGDGDGDGDDDKDNKDKKDKKVSMEQLKDLIEDLAKDIKDIRSEIHTTQESVDANKVNYDKIQEWVVNEFGGELKEQIANGVQKWINEEYTKELSKNIEGWVCEQFAPTIEGWVNEQFAPTVEGWICEQFAPTIEGWVNEQFAPTVEGWINEQFAPTINNWVNEQFAPTVQQWLVEQYTPTVETWLNEHYGEEQNNKICENVNAFFESKKDENLDRINSILETVANTSNPSDVARTINESIDDKYATEYIVANMPSQYKPSWNMCSESKKDEIMNRSKIYDFTKDGVLEQFWSTTDFTEKQVNENEDTKTPMYSVYEQNVFAQMRKLNRSY